MRDSWLPPKYAQKIASIVSQIQPSARVDIVSADILSVNGKQLDLVNVFRSAQSKQQDPMPFLRKYLTHLLSLDLYDLSNFDLIKSDIFPRIQPVSLLEQCNEEYAMFSFVNGTKICYAIDLPNMIVTITRHRMEEWGIRVEELDEIARKNLAEATPDFNPQVSPAEDGGWIASVSSGDSYESSRILLPKFYEDLSQFLHGDFFAFIPARGCLVCCSKNPDSMVSRLQKNAMRVYESAPYPITPKPFLITLDGIAGT